MPDPPHLKLRTALLVSIGTSPEPIKTTLIRHRPDIAWFFCSAETFPVAQKIYRELIKEFPTWNLSSDYIEVEQFEDLGLCYEKLRASIPSLFTKWKVAQENVTVD